MVDQSATHLEMRIRETRDEARDTRSFVLDGSLPAEPGQFVMLWIPGLDEKPFCVADADPLTLVVRRVGPLTEELFARRPGDRLRMRGPFGRGFCGGAVRLLLVGGGYGAAPLGFLAKRVREAGGSAVLAVGARTAEDLLVPALARECAELVRTATEDGSAGFRGRVTGLAQELLAGGGFDRLCACGPEAMLEAVGRLAGEAGLEAELSFERYMRCGIGICGSCSRSGRLVCSDGPVLRVPPGAMAP